MYNDKLSHCPVCGEMMAKGFAVRNSSLSWVPVEKMQQWAFVDKDLNERGLKKLLPVQKAAYDLSHHCRKCQIYIVDYSKSFSRQEANDLAASV